MFIRGVVQSDPMEWFVVCADAPLGFTGVVQVLLPIEADFDDPYEVMKSFDVSDSKHKLLAIKELGDLMKRYADSEGNRSFFRGSDAMWIMAEQVIEATRTLKVRRTVERDYMARGLPQVMMDGAL